MGVAIGFSSYQKECLMRCRIRGALSLSYILVPYVKPVIAWRPVRWWDIRLYPGIPWAQRDLNPQHPACKAGTLPIELCAHALPV